MTQQELTLRNLGQSLDDLANLDCSMVQATYRLNGEIVGTMAVLGPTRMEYRKVIAVMNYLHHYLETLLKNPDGFRDTLRSKS